MKRFISTVLIALMIFTIVPTSAMAISGSFPIPNITLKNMEIPALEAGKINTLQLAFENVGNAFDIVLTPSFGDDTPFIPTNITDSINITNPSQPFDLKLNVKSG